MKSNNDYTNYPLSIIYRVWDIDYVGGTWAESIGILQKVKDFYNITSTPIEEFIVEDKYLVVTIVPTGFIITEVHDKWGSSGREKRYIQFE